jgi:hypothetical protein
MSVVYDGAEYTVPADRLAETRDGTTLPCTSFSSNSKKGAFQAVFPVEKVEECVTNVRFEAKVAGGDGYTNSWDELTASLVTSGGKTASAYLQSTFGSDRVTTGPAVFPCGLGDVTEVELATSGDDLLVLTEVNFGYEGKQYYVKVPENPEWGQRAVFFSNDESDCEFVYVTAPRLLLLLRPRAAVAALPR